MYRRRRRFGLKQFKQASNVKKDGIPEVRMEPLEERKRYPIGANGHRMKLREVIAPMVSVNALICLSHVRITKDNRLTTLPLWQSIWNVLVGLNAFLVGFGTFYGKALYVYPRYAAMVVLIDALETYLLPFFCATQILTPTLLTRSNIKRFLEIVEKVDDYLDAGFERTYPLNRYLVQFQIVIAYILFGAYASLYMYLNYAAVGLEFAVSNFYRVYFAYFLFFDLLQFLNLLVILQYRIKKLNEVFLRDLNDLQAIKPGTNIVYFPEKALDRIKRLIDTHEKLIDAMDYLNFAYGYNLLFVYFLLLPLFVMQVNMAVFFKFDRDSPDWTESSENGLRQIISGSVWFVFVLAGVSTFLCEKVQGEMNCTLDYVVDFMVSRKLTEDVTHELQILINQIDFRAIKFSTGFFDIRMSLIFETMGTIVTYVIIILQVEGLIE